MKLTLAHLTWSVALGVAAGVVAGEGWGVALVVVGLALVAFHLGRRLAPGDTRLLAMGWWLPPAALLLIAWDTWRG